MLGRNIGARSKLQRGALSRYDRMRFQWLDIQDIIGSHSLWPINIRMMIWKPEFEHFERKLLAAFFCVNGLHYDVLIKFLQLVNPRRHESDYRCIRQLMKAFDKNPSKYKYWGYNISQKRFEFISGRIRFYGGKIITEKDHRHYYGEVLTAKIPKARY